MVGSETSVDLEMLEARLTEKIQQRDLAGDVTQLLGFAFDHAEIPMMATTIFGEMILTNDRLIRALGYPDKTWQYAQERLHPDDQNLSEQWGIEAVVHGRDSFRVHLRYQHADGHWLTFLVTSRSMRDDDGDVLWFYTQMLDITDRLQAQRALQEQADVLKNTNRHLAEIDASRLRLLAATSHDLRSPLTTIVGFSQMLSEQDARISEADRRRYAGIIHEQAGRLSRMVDDLMSLARMEAGDTRHYPERFNVHEHVKQAAADRGALVEVDERLHAWADPAHVDRILDNYLTNALKYGSSPITIHAMEQESMILIEVADRGTGVDPAFAPHLFEPFQQSATTSKHASKGNGLGLAIVKGMAKAAGGDAWYRPHPQGGSIFGFSLPTAPARSGEQDPPSPGFSQRSE